MRSELKILFEDNHLLVIDKPALLPTMGVRKGEDSLVHRAKEYLREKYRKPGNVFLGVVSRLDSHVSGIVVLARTSKAASRLSDQFRQRSPRKTYLAIIADDPDFVGAGRLQDRLIKNESQHRMMIANGSRTENASAKLASLVYNTLGRNGGQRLVKVELETGRKHQIRVQLAAAGCPIVGDRKYDSQLNFPCGIALHSFRLEFNHPTEKLSQSFQSVPPPFWRLERFGYDVGSVVNSHLP